MKKNLQIKIDENIYKIIELLAEDNKTTKSLIVEKLVFKFVTEAAEAYSDFMGELNKTTDKKGDLN